MWSTGLVQDFYVEVLFCVEINRLEIPCQMHVDLVHLWGGITAKALSTV